MLAVSASVIARPPASATWRMAPRMAWLSRRPTWRIVLAQRLEAADVVGDGRAAHVEHAADPGLGQLQATGRGDAHRLVLDQLGRGEAVVALDKGEIEQVEPRRGQRLLPGKLWALELHD